MLGGALSRAFGVSHNCARSILRMRDAGGHDHPVDPPMSASWCAGRASTAVGHGETPTVTRRVATSLPGPTPRARRLSPPLRLGADGGHSPDPMRIASRSQLVARALAVVVVFTHIRDDDPLSRAGTHVCSGRQGTGSIVPGSRRYTKEPPCRGEIVEVESPRWSRCVQLQDAVNPPVA